MKKMTSYIIAGVKADNEEVFMQRVGELLERIKRQISCTLKISTLRQFLNFQRKK